MKKIFSIVFLSFFFTSIFCADIQDLAPLPSEQTYQSEINPDREPVTKDWWEGTGPDEGPPTDGGGGGGAVGFPVGNGVLPVLCSGILYMAVVGINRKRKNR